MGLTCASLHLFLRDQYSATATTSFGQLAHDVGDPLGYERVNNPDDADRHLVAAMAPPWLSFFDLTNPDAVTAATVDLGKQLSAASKCPALLTSVVDSDAFAYLLFENGKQVDGYASARGLLPGRTKKWPPEKRAAEWSRLFGRLIGIEAVQAILRRDCSSRTTCWSGSVAWLGCPRNSRRGPRATLSSIHCPTNNRSIFARGRAPA